MRSWVVATRAARSVWIPVVLVGLSTSAGAQNQPGSPGGGGGGGVVPTDEAEWRQQMERRLRQLEQENVQLRSQVNDVAGTQQAVMKDAQSRGVLSMEGGEPRLTTPDFFDVNKFAAEGNFPGSVRIPRT